MSCSKGGGGGKCRGRRKEGHYRRRRIGREWERGRVEVRDGKGEEIGVSRDVFFPAKFSGRTELMCHISIGGGGLGVAR